MSSLTARLVPPVRAATAGVVLAFAAVQWQVVTTFLGVIVGGLLSDFGRIAVQLGYAALVQFGFVSMGYAYVRYRGVAGRPLAVPVARPTRRELGYVAGGTVVAFVVSGALAAGVNALDLVPEPTDSILPDEMYVETYRTELLTLAVFSVIVAGPTQEFFFRGVIQSRLREAFGPVGAIVGASVLFGAALSIGYVGSPVPVIVAETVPIVGVGAVLGAVYERARNLAVPALVYGGYNAVGLLLAAYGPV